MAPPFKTLTLTVALAILITPFAVRATIQLPLNMVENDRITALQIIGLGTSTKILTDPYPLGGYSGIEAGFSIESIPASALGSLGKGVTPSQQNVNLPSFTFGKGLFNNIDIFLHFTPYTSQDELSEYGALLRWGFYQASSVPLSASIVLHAGSADISNQLSTHSYGADLIGGVNVDRVALFAGAGYLESLGTFDGGPTIGGVSSSITDSGNEQTEVVTCFHAVVGIDIKVSDYFLAAQVDRYTQTVMSGKLGVRF